MWPTSACARAPVRTSQVCTFEPVASRSRPSGLKTTSVSGTLRDPVDASGLPADRSQIRAAPSCPAPATSDPSGENATRKAPPGDLRTRIRFAEGTDHSLTPASPAVATVLPSRAKTASVTVPLLLPGPERLPVTGSPETDVPPRASPVMTIAPSGLNLATDTGAPSCSVRSRAPVVEFQIRAVPSELAVTTRRPSGLNSAPSTARLCERTCSRRRPRTLQIRAVPSAPADTMRRPTGSNDAPSAAPRCAPRGAAPDRTGRPRVSPCRLRRR